MCACGTCVYSIYVIVPQNPISWSGDQSLCIQFVAVVAVVCVCLHGFCLLFL